MKVGRVHHVATIGDEDLIDYILHEMKRCLLLGATYRMPPEQISVLLGYLENDDSDNLAKDEEFWRTELGIGDC